MFYSRLFLLSALWRPHSEQIKFWIAASAKDAEMLSLARIYLRDLDLSNVVVTLEDGLELADFISKVKYPQESRAISFLAKHFEATCSELTTQNLRQLSADMRLAGGDLDHYEATLGSSSFFAAFSRCIHSSERAELVQLALPFCKFVNQRGSQTKLVASHLLQIVANELARQLNESGNKAEFLDFLAKQNLPLAAEQWEVLKRAVFAQTALLDAATLQSLLGLIVTHQVPSPNSAWGSVIQETLVNTESISKANACSVVTNVLRCNCPVANSLIDLLVEDFQELSANAFLFILTAWQDAKLSSCELEFFSSSSIISLEACTEKRLGRFLNPSFSDDSLLWVYCLSFFSVKKAAFFLKLRYADSQKTPKASAKAAALLCKVMINTNEFLPVVVHSVRAHAKSDLLDQEESIAVLHVCQKTGERAPQELVKRAAGRLGWRLVTSHSQGGAANLALSSNSFAVLLAGLSFVDDEEQLTLLKRLLQVQQLTPAVAMTVLRYTRDATSRTCQFTRAKIVKKLIEAAHKFTAEELSFTMTVLAELKIRDAAAIEHLLRELEIKKPSFKDVVAAGKAAKTLRLNSAFEQLNVVSSLHELSDIIPADLLTILRCCRMERRRDLLSFEKVRTILNTVDINEIKTSDLVLLFSVCASNVERRDSISKAMTVRDPVMRHDIDLDDVIDAFECAVSAPEIEGICKICTNAPQDLSEQHLMRLLRCAQRYSTTPNRFCRFVGKSILVLVSNGRLSPNNALLWTKFYWDHQIKDDSVGKCLVLRAADLKTSPPPDLHKTLQKAAKLYGVEKKSIKNPSRQSSKAKRIIWETS
ncbi:hypothetical protein ABB37_03242 [Leptomonas pyrrhocoris]|uniref:Uncharacterized protein n=1 Tax=Leptomonas pyrrhocoris TaxID=157538 RepID=A0A0N0DWQ8_LEPPY|nr:hypothetical protein ABB37_03242 [Leptomonas pyrrhocoris]XP_015660526.1 hypothetical protein ABB37_03242 [Leptomonas pyrrhocoris]XP_015660527.1 hypothetical protein ABB37_03242 [Leptomonas pyrrhocoris]XP_015660528.1 hypothetical protein ABB37_03242 [Leptomonas pyrrhocoris]XP_015660529.1 hypothetical protein ABB37_03242 [Leptomonas pyrrhocoris]KPA82086.1 hypothetical protein ABB37_03242 [Leptomonas pyrrhocoris]KPA82087.1 hypothetical protein ABB37_03242 [Leptomonas pyrrhocoris]KPA82088.1 h|eukprot:XP_015660525.1 hypothetical protein ABB37_03242 [Leptomonas pyrrhocoris]